MIYVSKVYRFYSILALLLLQSTMLFATCLFDKGKTDYSIVVAQNASESEKTAAKELAMYLKQISGADFPVTNNLNCSGKCFIVGYNARTAQMAGVSKPAAEDEAFVYKTVGDNLVIVGGSKRGTMYGVFAFLENELGVRWYTADYTKIPKCKAFTFNNIHRSEKPALKLRYPMYYVCTTNSAWAAHNRSNYNWNAQKNQYGGREACLGAHTLGTYIAADDYWDSHPEYFAERNGKRTKNAQRCLSNNDVLNITIKKTLQSIKSNPDYLYYDVSQLDNNDFCECKKCKAIEQKYGSEHSGIILWFVNKVAEAVEKQYPGKKVCTLAYQYGRTAPKNIVARKNVAIRLCTNNCCRSHALETCPENASFKKDLQGWSRCAQELMIWDYVVNFYQYNTPYPNFATFADNLDFFARNNVSSTLLLGQYQSASGEFNELKAWMLAKLLWNPKQDVDKLAKEFISDYYGAASSYVFSYYQLCKNLAKSDIHLKNGIEANSPLFTESFITESEKLLDRAYRKCKTQQERNRVEDVQAQILSLRVGRTSLKSASGDLRLRYNNYLKKRTPRINENQTTEEYFKQIGDI